MSEMAFSQWFAGKLAEKQMSQADFAREYQREAGLKTMPSGRISEWASGANKPGKQSFVPIARVFRIEPEEVFRAASGLKDADDGPRPPAVQVAELAKYVPWDPVKLGVVLDIMNGWIAREGGSQS